MDENARIIGMGATRIARAAYSPKKILTDFHGGWPRCVGGLAADTKRSK